jgi:hypothetical protein
VDSELFHSGHQSNVSANYGKKIDEGTMMLPSAPISDPTAVVGSSEPRQTQILTPVTIKEATDFLINCKIVFYG